MGAVKEHMLQRRDEIIAAYLDGSVTKELSAIALYKECGYSMYGATERLRIANEDAKDDALAGAERALNAAGIPT
jgi:hypothetical protein